MRDRVLLGLLLVLVPTIAATRLDCKNNNYGTDDEFNSLSPLPQEDDLQSVGYLNADYDDDSDDRRNDDDDSIIVLNPEFTDESLTPFENSARQKRSSGLQRGGNLYYLTQPKIIRVDPSLDNQYPTQESIFSRRLTQGGRSNYNLPDLSWERGSHPSRTQRSIPRRKYATHRPMNDLYSGPADTKVDDWFDGYYKSLTRRSGKPIRDEDLIKPSNVPAYAPPQQSSKYDESYPPSGSDDSEIQRNEISSSITNDVDYYSQLKSAWKSNSRLKSLVKSYLQKQKIKNKLAAKSKDIYSGNNENLLNGDTNKQVKSKSWPTESLEAFVMDKLREALDRRPGSPSIDDPAFHGLLNPGQDENDDGSDDEVEEHEDKQTEKENGEERLLLGSYEREEAAPKFHLPRDPTKFRGYLRSVFRELYLALNDDQQDNADS